ARLPRLPERVAPGAAVPHDLGAVDLAAPAEGDEVGLLLAPARERVRPLAGAPRLEGLLAARDHPAVHDSRDHRRELAGGRGEHRLVEQREPLPEALLADAREPLRVHGEREEVAVAEALRDPGRSPGGLERRPVVARALVLQRDGHHQVPALGAVAAFALDETLRPRPPARRGTELAAEREVDADEERGAGGAERLALRDECTVGAIERREEVVDAAEHVVRVRERLQVGGRERRLRVGPREGGAGVGPGPGRERPPSLLEEGGHRANLLQGARARAQPGSTGSTTCEG